MNPSHQITEYLAQLDIDADASSIYLALTANGPSSALQLAKLSNISRTQIYRHLEQLESISLVSQEKLSYGTLFRSLPIENLDATLAAKQQTATELRNNLSDMASVVRQLAGGPKDEATNVTHYYGLAGIKQANWNLTRADREYFVFEVARLTEHLDRKFALRHRERCMERGIISHDLTNRPVVTKAELEPFNPDRSYYRYIDPKILTINFEMYMYNDIVTLIDYGPANMHAIEIKSPLLNKMMTQIYMAIWNQATPINLS